MDACEIRVLHDDALRAAQACLVDDATAAGLAQTFQALADPTRVRIISALSAQELCVCDLAALLGMTQSAVSHQLRLLRHLRLVRHRKEGRVVYYAVDDEHIRDLFQRGLEHYQHQGEPQPA
jgi:ArsR family transcriptional regulator, lead/cadmium/zinc/bismuth-responsive transcriptional repressor